MTPPQSLPVARRLAAWIGVVLAVLAAVLIGFWQGVPAAVRWALAEKASPEIGRAVSVESAAFNPFNLHLTLRGLKVAGAGPADPPLLRAEEIRASVSLTSLVRLAPVLDELAIRALQADIARTGPNTFDFEDILERQRARPPSPEPARFAVYNISVADSELRFDDRVVGRKHVLREITLGLPFVSSLPTHREVKVQPGFSARLDGTPLRLDGETRPFKESLETSLRLRLDAYPIPPVLAYAPVRLNFSLDGGLLDTDLKLAFVRDGGAAGTAGQSADAKDAPAPPRGDRLTLSGTLAVREFALKADALAARPALQWKALAIDLGTIEPLSRRAALQSITLDGLQVDVRRAPDGTIDWQRFARAPVGDPAAPRPAPAAGARTAAAPAPAATTPSAPARNATGGATGGAAAAPFAFSLTEFRLGNGIVRLRDDAVRTRLELNAIDVTLAGLSNAAGTTARLEAAATTGNREGLKAAGTLAIAPLDAKIGASLESFDLRTAAPYLAPHLDGTVRGTVSAGATVLAAERDGALRLGAEALRLQVDRLAVRPPASAEAQLDIERIALDGGTLDLDARRLALGKLTIAAPRGTATRLADGRIGWLQMLRQPPGGAAPSAESPAPAAAQPAAAPAASPPAAPAPAPRAAAPDWAASLEELSVQRADLTVTDRTTAPAFQLRVRPLEVAARDLSTEGRQPATFRVGARFPSGGTLATNGTLRLNPVNVRAAIDARSLDVSALRAYAADRVNLTLASAEFSSRGNLEATLPDGRPPVVSFNGSARLANLRALDGAGESELLRWQVLDVDRVALKLADGPPSIDIGTVALSEFFARIIVSAQGRLNLVDVFRPGAAEAEAAKAKSNASAATGAPAARAAAGPTADAPRPKIRIEGIKVDRGDVNFTDNFIRPNYTAQLTGIGGTVSTLDSENVQPATVELAGSIDNEAPVRIAGTVHPLQPQLFLDIAGGTQGVDLPRFTPYSARYAGYPIVKGKLTMEVRYRIENDKLDASNRLFIDQFTFGERVDSPDAIKLPVAFAVSLLKNARGEIDLTLPVTGTLSDPQFRLGPIIWQVVVNLLTKIVTSPFTALAAAFGPGAELGYVEFAPGSAVLGGESLKRLDLLAKALNDRPALRLDIIGRAIAEQDTEGVRRARYEELLRAAKVRRLVRETGAAVDPTTVTVQPAEREALITAVYRDTDIAGRPRNFIGMLRTLPVPEMEQRILAHLAVTPDALRQLANQRASAVRNHLESRGGVDRARLFLVEPKLDAQGIADKGAPTRVDFSLK